MTNSQKKFRLLVLFSTAIVFLTIGNANAQGNRYDLTRLYNAEISAAKTYIDSRYHFNHRWSHLRRHNPNSAIIIDVRRIEEFTAGHAPGAINIPFPYITGTPDMPFDNTDFIGYDISTDPDIAQTMANFGIIPMSEFVDYVSAKIPNKDRYIITMCRTGYRSVQTANLLAKSGYTNVYNMWEGFEGQYKLDVTGTAVDVNNDGEVTDTDKDGWKFFQNLPVRTKYRRYQMFLPYEDLYYYH